MKIFVFGASGYLGSRLVNYLQNSHEVYALVRSNSSLTRLACKETKIISGIEKYASLSEAFKVKTPDLIINTAALYGRKNESLEEIVEANISFPCRLYELCKEYKVSCFLNTGTSLPDNVSHYALTKNTFVKLASTEKAGSLKFINVALEHFYGPNDDESKFTSYVINSCLSGKALNLTSGKQRRDFIYIKDVLTAYEIIVKQFYDIKNCESIALGSGTAHTVREVVETIAKVTSSRSALDFGSVPDRENELMYSCADTNLIKSIGWSNEYNLIEGITETISKEHE